MEDNDLLWVLTRLVTVLQTILGAMMRCGNFSNQVTVSKKSVNLKQSVFAAAAPVVQIRLRAVLVWGEVTYRFPA